MFHIHKFYTVSKDFAVITNTDVEFEMSKNVKRRLSLTLTPVYVKALDQLVDEGIYMEHQVAIRAALRLLFRVHRIEPFLSELVGVI